MTKLTPRQNNLPAAGAKRAAGAKHAAGNKHAAEATRANESRSPRPTRWLVSVRSEAEFLLASQFAVDIIDFKEPSDGPLSPVNPSLWRTASRLITGQTMLNRSTQLSAALGEPSEMLRVADHVPSNFAFAKVGPSDCDSDSKLTALWADADKRLPPTVELVAVAYADYKLANCLPPERVFQLAAKLSIGRCLLDTYTKDGRSTIDALGLDRLQRISSIAQQQGLWWTMAGSIQLENLRDLATKGIRPDCFGVRGDVCNQSRTSELSADRLRSWSAAMQSDAERKLRPV